MVVSRLGVLVSLFLTSPGPPSTGSLDLCPGTESHYLEHPKAHACGAQGPFGICGAFSGVRFGSWGSPPSFWGDPLARHIWESSETSHHSVAMRAILGRVDVHCSGVSLTAEARESGRKDERKTRAACHDAALVGSSAKGRAKQKSHVYCDTRILDNSRHAGKGHLKVS